MRLDLTFNEHDMYLSMDLSESKESFKMDFGELHTITTIPDEEAYSGEYTVVPQIEQQVLRTASKYMKTDLTITAIPYHVTGNNSGGDTIYIGKELNLYGN